jgi:hypothetical protein
MALIFIGRTMGNQVNLAATAMGKCQMCKQWKYQRDPVDKKYSP